MAENPTRTATMPITGIGDPNVWKDFIDTTDSMHIVLLAAEQMAANHLSVTEPSKERPINYNFTRVELIFLAFKRYFDMPKEESELKNGLQKINELLDNLIKNGSLYDLIQLGKLLTHYKSLFPVDMWHRKIRKIFETLESMENIKRISDEVALKKDGIDW